MSYSVSRVFEADILEGKSLDSSGAVIRNVKVLGLQSRNTAASIGLSDRVYGKAAAESPYRYSEQCLADAVPLYEGAQVVIDHPDFAYTWDGKRSAINDHSVRDVVGALRNVRYEAGRGLFADLQLLESHEYTKTLIEIAEKDPSLVGLSHEAEFAAPRLVQGVVQIETIRGVACVAVVVAPATTNGLYESAGRKGSLVERFRRPPVDRAPEVTPAAPAATSTTQAKKPDLSKGLFAAYPVKHVPIPMIDREMFRW